MCVWREHVGTQSSVNIILPSDIGEVFRSEGLHPERMTLQPWATHRETRQHSKGVFLKSVDINHVDRDVKASFRCLKTKLKYEG